jgi:hypothetical protein
MKDSGDLDHSHERAYAVPLLGEHQKLAQKTPLVPGQMVQLNLQPERSRFVAVVELVEQAIS